MNSEVAAVVEIESRGGKENCRECTFAELGQASRDTQGGFLGIWDGGLLRWGL